MKKNITKITIILSIAFFAAMSSYAFAGMGFSANMNGSMGSGYYMNGYEKNAQNNHMRGMNRFSQHMNNNSHMSGSGRMGSGMYGNNHQYDNNNNRNMYHNNSRNNAQKFNGMNNGFYNGSGPNFNNNRSFQEQIR